MTNLEVLEFTEAQDQVKNGQFNEALPKLYRLAATYPQDQEIQGLIRYCLGVQGQYQQPIQAYYSTPIAPTQPVTKKGMFIIPAVGILIMAASIFLPWLDFIFIGKNNSSRGDFTVFGSPSGSVEVYSILRPEDLTGTTNALNSTVIVWLVIIIALATFVSAAAPSRTRALLPLIASFIGLLFTGWEYLTLATFVTQVNRNLIIWPADSPLAGSATLQIATGLLVWAIGIAIALLGNIITCAARYKITV